MRKDELRIVFMGTPDFAVPSLEILIKNKYNVVGVVTAPDKPAGRGLQIQTSAVKKFAVENNLHILQPEKLKSETFIQELKSLNANLQIVVAFRMLPEMVWQMPELGTFNLHGSLLPQYRGAAPINWAVMNGEKETGVTTFFLQHEIDTGKIIHSAKCPINAEDTAGSIHDKLMFIGADLVLKTVEDIVSGEYKVIAQDQLLVAENGLKIAPKIHKADCKINWDNSCENIVNKVRGLNPFPTAFAEFKHDSETLLFKIFETKKEQTAHEIPFGQLVSDNKSFLKVAVRDGFVQISSLQLAGKKRMSVSDFLRGYQFSGTWIAV
ncbi:MAG: methionyl-tRNA formyltransferase [Bacteroidetes bacterium]|nr:methionyl-tRNA formyltransferase [Bacteroidota bacterium]